MVEVRNSKNKSHEMNIFNYSFWFSIIIFSILIGVICIFPYWFTSNSNSSGVDFSKTGQIGDTIGGIMGPFIAIAAAVLTFIAFWVQYQANRQQVAQFQRQAEDVTIERFESKFYELLRIQRGNINEIQIGSSLNGRKAFISMFFEFRFCYAMTKKFIEDYNHEELGFESTDEPTILDIAYHIFFMGIGDNSDKLVIVSLAGRCEQQFLFDLISYLHIHVKETYELNSNEVFRIKLHDNPNVLQYSSKYMPLGGHISRLGHYFRHLFQAVKFIAEQDQELFPEDKKCEYTKTLRAQLSDYEQLLLFYNVVSTLGNAWTKEPANFIKRFRMIKNMPTPLADFAILPNERFASEIEFWKRKGKSFFEWDER
jgi:hypothetical protein